MRCTLPDGPIVAVPASRITCATGFGGAAKRAGRPLQLSGASATGSDWSMPFAVPSSQRSNHCLPSASMAPLSAAGNVDGA